MRITAVTTRRMWAGTRNWLFVKVETDRGLHGWGEGSLEWWEDAVEAAVHVLERLLVGQDPLRVGALHVELVRRLGWRGGPIHGSAVAAIDQALWDIAGKARGVPVHELLGGALRDRVRAYASGGYTFADAEQAVELARTWTGRGFDVSKANPAEARRTPIDDAAIDQTLAVMQAVRSALGPGVDLLLDCHGSPTPPMALRLAEAVAPFRPLFLEEPVQSGDLAALLEVSRKSPVPIATGEKLVSREEFRPIVDRRAASVVQPDLSHAYGITGVLRIAQLAEDRQVWVAPHNSCGPVGTAAALHLDAVIPNFLIQEIATYALPYMARIARQAFAVREGYLDLPTGPGLGVDLDEEAIAANPPRPMPLRDYRHADGSWSGW
jgi:galactonate dehydratase